MTINNRRTINHRRTIKIVHRNSQVVLAEGPLGWGITQFEGNYYCRRQFINQENFKLNYVPGICIYKFLYVWLDLIINQTTEKRFFAWMYWFPNPLFPFIWFRIAIPGGDPEIEYILSEPKS